MNEQQQRQFHFELKVARAARRLENDICDVKFAEIYPPLTDHWYRLMVAKTAHANLGIEVYKALYLNR